MWDNAMRFIHQPGKFDPEAPNSRIAGLLHRVPPPPPETAMELDMQGRYLLFNNRPGSANPVTEVDIDYAYRVDRRTVFRYALGWVLAPTDREALSAFRRHKINPINA